MKKDQEKRSELIEVKATKIEKKIIRDKAKTLNISTSEYVRICCCYSNVSDIFMKQLYESNILHKNYTEITEK